MVSVKIAIIGLNKIIINMSGIFYLHLNTKSYNTNAANIGLIIVCYIIFIQGSTMNWSCAWIVSNAVCFALAAIANANVPSKSFKRGLSRLLDLNLNVTLEIMLCNSAQAGH